MGNNYKAKELAYDARIAKEKGHVIFIARLYSRLMSGSIDDWADIIEEIELQGWTMENWQVCLDRCERPEAFAFFRLD